MGSEYEKLEQIKRTIGKKVSESPTKAGVASEQEAIVFTRIQLTASGSLVM